MQEEKGYVDSTSIKLLWWIISAFSTVLIGGGSLWASAVNEDLKDINKKAELAQSVSSNVSIKIEDIIRRIDKVELGQDKIVQKQENIKEKQDKIESKIDILLNRSKLQ